MKKLLLCLLLTMSVCTVCACGDKSKDKKKKVEVTTEEATTEAMELVRVTDVELDDNENVVKITFNKITYTIPDDVKEEFEETDKIIYVMNDSRAFHIIGTEVYVEVYESESIEVDTLDDSSLTETTEVTSETTTVVQEVTTKAPETTTKAPEPTTKKEDIYKDLSADNRNKNCELQLISRLKEFDRWDNSKEDYVACTMYEIDEKKYNPYLQIRDLGWENVFASGGADLYDAYSEEDDFSVKHPNDSRAAIVDRDIQWSKKYLGAIISECDAWVTSSTKTSAKAFEDYLVSKYTYNGVNSIFKNSANPDGFVNDEYMNRTKEFCEQWCYYDTVDKQYKPEFRQITDFGVYVYEQNGYFDNLTEMENWVRFTGGCEHYANGSYVYVRWYYDKNANKTTVYMVFGA